MQSEMQLRVLRVLTIMLVGKSRPGETTTRTITNDVAGTKGANGWIDVGGAARLDAPNSHARWQS